MYKSLLSNIDGLNVWAIVGLLLFMMVFLGTVIYSICLSQKFTDKMGHLPLEEDEKEGQNNVK
ncbi:MAG: hypothetical protein MK193_01515 [Lentisphaeria bacterium]|nr:hypothetical protein [Lentisphaeria bacterium]